MSEYSHLDIEKKWQQHWADNATYKVDDKSDKPKYYVLDMFPYPSGAGLHVGHPLGYIASDIYSRFKVNKGYNVLHPMGYDSFGLPAEQYAIETGQHPAKTTEDNIKRYRGQLDQIGFGYDWSREVRTSSPEYYKWTQWIFKEIFNSWYNKDTDKAEDISTLISEFEQNGNANVNAVCDEDTPNFSAEEWNNLSEKEKSEMLMKYRLTYLADTMVNWCEALGTVLANDEVKDGVSERGGHPVIQKKMTQWMMRITAYSERLLQGLDKIDWSDNIKEIQRNWIGKSNGASVKFSLPNSEDKIEVFTTRPDTIFGVSFMVLAPEHELVNKITTAEQKAEIEAYQKAAALKSERERQAEVKNITGVFTGAYAIHPFTGKQVPIWIGDYVLAGYGTGAVMAVPCGDQRDYDFARHFNLEIPNIFEGADISETAQSDKSLKIANSDFLNGLNANEAIAKAISEIEARGLGKGKTNYRLRDAVFSRQRYWGEPFPVFYDNEVATCVEDEFLPIPLPNVESYLPTKDGQPPLGNAKTWSWCKNKKIIKDNEKQNGVCTWPLELNTMPGWAGSSWYFLRYMDPNNKERFADKDKVDYWQNVDLYLGGSEHATGHLLYSRFWTKFLFDKGEIPFDEPFKKLINQGMILGRSSFVYRVQGSNKFVSFGLRKEYKTTRLHVDINMVDGDVLDTEAFKKWRPEYANAEFILEDGKYICGHEVEKMSKSKYNVQTPDDLVQQYGADTLRMYEMFLGPIEQAKPWDTKGINGVHGFLKKFWRLFHQGDSFNVSSEAASKDEMKTLHKCIKKVSEDIENFSFNTSVSAFMIAVNELTTAKCNKKDVLKDLCILLSPFAPHICEELWEKMGEKGSVTKATYPKFKAEYLVESAHTYPVSFNGKMRFKVEFPLDMDKDAISAAILEHENAQKYLDGKAPKKVIVVPKKIINVVV